MGIDVHALQLLRHAQNQYGALGKTVTLGRQVVFLTPTIAQNWTGNRDRTYCETMLINKFGASDVDSIDNSPYEGATIIADFNEPIPEPLTGHYDTVLDFGCTEHIFNIAQSLKNIAKLCTFGGKILHVVPSNGFCGHGFYQFSPELFFSWYTPENGFSNTEVYLAELYDQHHWYRVPPPANGKRINVQTSTELYVIVLSQREDLSFKTIQQSDYLHTWNQESPAPSLPKYQGRLSSIRELLNRQSLTARLAHTLDARFNREGPKPLHRHPNLQRISLPSL